MIMQMPVTMIECEVERCGCGKTLTLENIERQLSDGSPRERPVCRECHENGIRRFLRNIGHRSHPQVIRPAGSKENTWETKFGVDY